MAKKDIYQVLEQRYSSESDLTVSMMKRAISELHIVNPKSFQRTAHSESKVVRFDL